MLTPASTSQSRITLNEPDMVLNVRVSACRRPFEPGIRRHTVTVSLPTSSPATRSNMTSIASLPFHPEGGHRLPAPVRRDLCQDTDPRARSNNPVTPETPRHTPATGSPAPVCVDVTGRHHQFSSASEAIEDRKPNTPHAQFAAWSQRTLWKPVAQ